MNDINSEKRTKDSMEKNKNKLLMLLILAIIAALLIGGIIGYFLSGSRAYKQRVTSAEKLLKEGDYVTAEAEYQDAISIKPKETKAREGLAFTYFLQERNDDAVNIYTELKESSGDSKYESAIYAINNGLVPRVPDIIPGEIEDFFPELTEIQSDDIPDNNGLNSFLQYLFDADYLEYYYRQAEQSNILHAIITPFSCVNYDLYPGEAIERHYASEGTKDPRGWCASGSESWNVFYEEKVVWILKNIFHASDEAISKLKSNVEDQYHYYEDGKYYRIIGGRGRIDFKIQYEKIKTDGRKYYITYRMEDYGGTKAYDYAYAVIEPVEIDDATYWTLYYNMPNTYQYYDKEWNLKIYEPIPASDDNEELSDVDVENTGSVSRRGNDYYYILDDYTFINESENENGEMTGHIEGISAVYRSDQSGKNKELIYQAEEGCFLHSIQIKGDELRIRSGKQIIYHDKTIENKLITIDLNRKGIKDETALDVDSDIFTDGDYLIGIDFVSPDDMPRAYTYNFKTGEKIIYTNDNASGKVYYMDLIEKDGYIYLYMELPVT